MNPIANYTLVDVSAGATILGNGQTTDNRIWRGIQHTVVDPNTQGDSGRVARTSILQDSEGLAIGMFTAQNRSAATVIFGIGGRIANNLWKAGQWVDATTTYTDDTTDAQDAGATDFALETTTVNDGIVILSQVPFNAISIDVGTTSVHAGGVTRVARHSDAAGTGWTNLTTADMLLFTSAAIAYTSGTPSHTIFAMPPPGLVWGKTTDSGAIGTGIPGGYYALNIRATDAAETTAGVADTIGIYNLAFLQEGVTDNSFVSWDGGGAEIWIPGADGLVAMFGTANSGNRVTALVRSR